MTTEVLALIPARGGSKSMPRKNLRMLAGKPMLVHSIEHALSSKRITRVVLTTDDKEIADVGKNAGAEVPFLRPVQYAQDLSTDYEFVRHALEWFHEHENYSPDLVVQLRPTTPIRNIHLIDLAIEKLENSPNADSLRAIVECCFSPYKMWSISTEGYLYPILELPGVIEHYNQPRQILPRIYQQDGFIDITRPRTIFNYNSITGKRILPFLIDAISIDIDYENELALASKLMKEEQRG